MKDFVILTDTGCDLERSFREQYGIHYVPMSYILDGVAYDASLDWEPISAPDFYNLMREGKRITTAQVNVEAYKNAYRRFLGEGKDVLTVAVSGGLSASVRSAETAREEVLKEFPDGKIVIVDALRACYALGLLAIRASELRSEGKSIDEVAEWILANRLTVVMEGSVDSLKYLKQAGRVSAASAFFGGLLQIKPLICADAQGKNFAYEKVKGRMASLVRIAERVAEQWEEVEYQRLFICHADCYDEAETLRRLICEKLGKEVDAHIGFVGPCIGATVGPGMLGVFFYGKEVTLNK